MEGSRLSFHPDADRERDGNILEFSFIKDGEEKKDPQELFPELRDQNFQEEPTLGRFVVSKNYELVKDVDGNFLFRRILQQVRFHVFVGTDPQSLRAQHASILGECIAREIHADQQELEALSLIPFEEAILLKPRALQIFLLSIREALKKICLPIVGILQFERKSDQSGFFGRMHFQRGSSMGDFLNGDPLLDPDFFKKEFLHELKKRGIPIEAIFYTSDPSLSRRS